LLVLCRIYFYGRFHFIWFHLSPRPAGCCSPGSSPSTLQVLTSGNLSAGASDRTSGSTYLPPTRTEFLELWV
jgi:hypothetical protein